MNSPPRLLHNIAALGSVQVVSYLLPLVTMPYVTRVLGVEAWGKLAFVQVILGFFSMFTNWGFAWSATRKISTVRDDHQKLSEIFVATWAAQWLLGVVAASILISLVLTVPFFRADWNFYSIGIFSIFTGLLFPVWFLNGLERMKQVATIQIITRLIAVPLIFIFVQTPENAPLMLGIGVATGLLGGFLTLHWIDKELRLHWRLPGWARVLAEIKEGSTIFGSTVLISLYTTLTPTILGIVAGPVAVGYYSLADKARQLVQSGLSPISQALFPRMSHLFKTNEAQAKHLLLRSAKLILLLSAIASLSLWLLAEYIVVLLAGEQFRPAITVLRWLAPLPFIISLSNILGVQYLIARERIKDVNNILYIAGFSALIITPTMIYHHGAIGAASAILALEVFVTCGFSYYVIKTTG